MPPPACLKSSLQGGDIFAEKLAEYACGGAGIPSADSHRALFISVDERHLPPVIDFAASINNATALSMEQAERWRRCAPDDFNEGCWLRETCASMDLN